MAGLLTELAAQPSSLQHSCQEVGTGEERNASQMCGYHLEELGAIAQLSIADGISHVLLEVWIRRKVGQLRFSRCARQQEIAY